MVRVKVWHTHTTVWLLKNYSQRILTFYTRILLLDLTYGRTVLEGMDSNYTPMRIRFSTRDRKISKTHYKTINKGFL